MYIFIHISIRIPINIVIPIPIHIYPSIPIHTPLVNEFIINHFILILIKLLLYT